MAARRTRSSLRSSAPREARLDKLWTIHQVRELHRDLQQQIDAGATLLDAADIEAVDTAGLQLLLAAARAAAPDDPRSALKNVSPQVAQGAQTLGLQLESSIAGSQP